MFGEETVPVIEIEVHDNKFVNYVEIHQDKRRIAYSEPEKSEEKTPVLDNPLGVFCCKLGFCEGFG
jgi:hypothetical protein